MLPYFYAVSAGLFLATSSLYWPAYTGLLWLQSWNDALVSGTQPPSVSQSPAEPTAERLLSSVFPHGVSLD